MASRTKRALSKKLKTVKDIIVDLEEVKNRWENTSKRVKRVLGLISQIAIDNTYIQNRELFLSGELDRKLERLLSSLRLIEMEMRHDIADSIYTKEDRERMISEIKRLSEIKEKMEKNLKKMQVIREEIQKLDEEEKRDLRFFLERRIFPHKSGKMVTPIVYTGKMKKNIRNPVLALDSYLLHKIGKEFEGNVFIVPAFSHEIEFAEHGKLIEITPGKSYRFEHPNAVVIPKKAQEVTKSEIDKHADKKDKILIIKGINRILNEKELAELIEKVNPRYVAVFGTWHERTDPEFEGVPVVDDKTIKILKKSGFQEITHKVISPEELEKVKKAEEKIKSSFEPWARYFPATKVKVFERVGREKHAKES